MGRKQPQRRLCVAGAQRSGQLSMLIGCGRQISLGALQRSISKGGGSSIVLRITGTKLPGRPCGPIDGFPGYDNIHVAVQRKDRPGELLDPQPADLDGVSWTLPCTAVAGPEGLALNGPYIQNRQSTRFVYLPWVTMDGQGAARMFRRGKLMLGDVGPELIAEVVERGQLRARLTLTDAKGNPICARLKPPYVQWSAESAE